MIALAAPRRRSTNMEEQISGQNSKPANLIKTTKVNEGASL